MKKLSYFILPVFFFGFIYFMFFNQIFQWKTFKTDTENRELSKFPIINVNKLDNYPSQFDTYLNDNFTFRPPFLNAYHSYKFNMGISPNIQDVIVGRNGHLFLAQKDQGIYEGKFDFNKTKLDSLLNIWQIRNEYFKSKNLDYYLLIAPNKHHVYPEDLPIGYREKNKNRTLIFKEIFDQQFPSKLIYPLNAILDKKENAYFKHDNHWTNKGAFIAYLQLLELIRKNDKSIKSLSEKDIKWKKTSTNGGNLLNFIGKYGEITETFYQVNFPKSEAKKGEGFNFKPTPGFPYPWDYEIHYTNEKALNKKKVLIIRDSFGESIIPFFNETFSETLYIFDGWKYGVNKEIIESYNPDIVLFLTLESFIDNVLEHPPIIDKE